MLNPKEVTIVYDTLLSSPGMNSTVKISLTINRKTLLMLTKVIGHGIGMKDHNTEGSLLAFVDKETLAEIKIITDTLLDKGGLTEMNSRLGALQTK